ncbi:hypothetical protein D3C71_1756420 [compost metagenome]
MQPGVGLDAGHKLDAVHAGHVDVGHDQVEVFAAQHVPAIHAVDRHRDFEPPVQQQLAFQLAHRQGIVHHQHALAAARLHDRPPAVHARQAPAFNQLLDRQQHIFDIQDQ